MYAEKNKLNQPPPEQAYFFLYMTSSPAGVSCTQLHVDGNFKPLNVNYLFFHNHNTFLTLHYITQYALSIAKPFNSPIMDNQLSPGDYALLDEENTSVIPETPNSIGQSLIRRLGLAEAEAASTFVNNTNYKFLIKLILTHKQSPMVMILRTFLVCHEY